MALKNQVELYFALDLLYEDTAAFIIYSVSKHKENYKRIQAVIQELYLAEDDTAIQAKLKKTITHLGNVIASDWSGEHYYQKERTEIQKAYDLLQDIYLMDGTENYMKAEAK